MDSCRPALGCLTSRRAKQGRGWGFNSYSSATSSLVYASVLSKMQGMVNRKLLMAICNAWHTILLCSHLLIILSY